MRKQMTWQFSAPNSIFHHHQRAPGMYRKYGGCRLSCWIVEVGNTSSFFLLLQKLHIWVKCMHAHFLCSALCAAPYIYVLIYLYKWKGLSWASSSVYIFTRVPDLGTENDVASTKKRVPTPIHYMSLLDGPEGSALATKNHLPFF